MISGGSREWWGFGILALLIVGVGGYLGYQQLQTLNQHRDTLHETKQFRKVSTEALKLHPTLRTAHMTGTKQFQSHLEQIPRHHNKSSVLQFVKGQLDRYNANLVSVNVISSEPARTIRGTNITRWNWDVTFETSFQKLLYVSRAIETSPRPISITGVTTENPGPDDTFECTLSIRTYLRTSSHDG